MYRGTSNEPYPACPRIGECAAVVEGGREGRCCKAKGQPAVCSGISPATTATLLYLRLYPHLRLWRSEHACHGASCSALHLQLAYSPTRCNPSLTPHCTPHTLGFGAVNMPAMAPVAAHRLSPLANCPQPHPLPNPHCTPHTSGLGTVDAHNVASPHCGGGDSCLQETSHLTCFPPLTAPTPQVLAPSVRNTAARRLSPPASGFQPRSPPAPDCPHTAHPTLQALALWMCVMWRLRTASRSSPHLPRAATSAAQSAPR